MDGLERIEKMLDMPDADKTQVMSELTSHYEEKLSELVGSGMEPSQAVNEAVRSLGDPEAIASSISAAHCVAPWRSALWAVLPFLGCGVAVAHGLLRGSWAGVALWLLVVCGAATAVGTVYGFRRGGRPVWLPVWTALTINFLYAGLGRIAPQVHKLSHDVWVSNAYVLSLLAPTIAAIWLCWRNPKWRLMAVATLVCGIASMLLPAQGTLWRQSPYWIANRAAFEGFVLVAWIVVALRVFALHSCGSPAQAALFVCALELTHPAGLNYFAPWWAPVAITAVAVASVIAFARASSFGRKVAVWGAAVLAYTLIVSAAAPVALPGQDLVAMVAMYCACAAVELVVIMVVLTYHGARRRRETREA